MYEIEWPMTTSRVLAHGPLTRYVTLQLTHAQGMPGMFPRHRGLAIPTCVTHVPWCMTGSLINGFLWGPRRGKRSRHSRRMHNTLFYVSGKRPIQTRCDLNKMVPILQTNYFQKNVSNKIGTQDRGFGDQEQFVSITIYTAARDWSDKIVSRPAWPLWRPRSHQRP